MMRSQALCFMKNFRCLLIVKISNSDENIRGFRSLAETLLWEVFSSVSFLRFASVKSSTIFIICEIKFVLPIILKSKKGLQRQFFAFSKLFFSASNLLLLFFDSLTIGTANRIELRQSFAKINI